MPVIHHSMRDIYERLKALGYTRKFIKDCLLPEWWEDRFAEVPANRAYVEAVLARQLNLDLSSLRDRSAKLRPMLKVSFRTQQKTKPQAS